MHELNLAYDPCELNPDYDFQACVRTSEGHKSLINTIYQAHDKTRKAFSGRNCGGAWPGLVEFYIFCPT